MRKRTSTALAGDRALKQTDQSSFASVHEPVLNLLFLIIIIIMKNVCLPSLKVLREVGGAESGVV